MISSTSEFCSLLSKITHFGIQPLIFGSERLHCSLFDLFSISHSSSPPLVQGLFIGILRPSFYDRLAGLLFRADDFGQGRDELIDRKEDHTGLFLSICEY